MRCAGLLRTTLRFKNWFLPCVTNPLVNTRPGRRIAQAALNLCRSLEQRSRLHEIRRRVDGDLLRGAERRAGVHARLSRRLAPSQEEGNNGANPIRNRQSVMTTVRYFGAICKAGVSPLNATVASCSRTSNSR